MTPAERQALNRRIAEKVMGWPQPDDLLCAVRPDGHTEFDPYRNSDDALEVLERLARDEFSRLQGYAIECDASRVFAVKIAAVLREGSAPGPHYGPAVCELARKWLEANANLAPVGKP